MFSFTAPYSPVKVNSPAIIRGFGFRGDHDHIFLPRDSESWQLTEITTRKYVGLTTAGPCQHSDPWFRVPVD
jgi:hypothetical protein